MADALFLVAFTLLLADNICYGKPAGKSGPESEPTAEGIPVVSPQPFPTGVPEAEAEPIPGSYAKGLPVAYSEGLPKADPIPKPHPEALSSAYSKGLTEALVKTLPLALPFALSKSLPLALAKTRPKPFPESHVAAESLTEGAESGPVATPDGLPGPLAEAVTKSLPGTCCPGLLGGLFAVLNNLVVALLGSGCCG